MKKIPLLLLVVICFWSCESRVRSHRLVVIGLDGLSVEGYQKAKHPHLDQLMAEGTLSLTTRSVMPSVTLPNWTSHLTASGPEQHGVVSNDWKLDNYTLPPTEKDEDGYFPSVFKVLKEQVPEVKTAFYYNWGNLINPINQRYLDEVHFEENDEYSVSYQKALDFIVEHKEKPTFVFLYSVHTDHAGHKHKWMSTEYISAIEEADKAIGNLLQELKAAGLYKDTHFMLITDHGGIEHGHGGVSTNEMNIPWAITGPGIQKGKLMTEPNNNPNTAKVISWLFGCEELPKSWVGEVPESIFE
ncbi:alkaline phosphatase family protein [Rapidithrix thailandica]|uniref:Alkaline phosphatase family protein n=1 Tax=Rapidithrix thailandica TaxID=413964 RepID=A0AAW9SHI6_9BACT